jgi:hypothetical protein
VLLHRLQRAAHCLGFDADSGKQTQGSEKRRVVATVARGDAVMLRELLATPGQDKYALVADERSGLSSILVGAGGESLFRLGPAGAHLGAGARIDPSHRRADPRHNHQDSHAATGVGDPRGMAEAFAPAA